MPEVPRPPGRYGPGAHLRDRRRKGGAVKAAGRNRNELVVLASGIIAAMAWLDDPSTPQGLRDAMELHDGSKREPILGLTLLITCAAIYTVLPMARNLPIPYEISGDENP